MISLMAGAGAGVGVVGEGVGGGVNAMRTSETVPSVVLSVNLSFLFGHSAHAQVLSLIHISEPTRPY